MGNFNTNTSALLKVFYTNADCLSLAKKDELEIYVRENSPDIIGITEVLPKRSAFSNQEVNYQLENYDMFLNQLTEGRGVIIYVKSHLNAELVKIETDFK